MTWRPPTRPESSVSPPSREPPSSSSIPSIVDAIVVGFIRFDSTPSLIPQGLHAVSASKMILVPWGGLQKLIFFCSALRGCIALQRETAPSNQTDQTKKSRNWTKTLSPGRNLTIPQFTKNWLEPESSGRLFPSRALMVPPGPRRVNQALLFFRVKKTLSVWRGDAGLPRPHTTTLRC
jgi:hypothetical protein